MIEVVPYDPAWPARFAELRDRFARALDGVEVLAIEHVGSTSVPGLAAKPVIDIDIVVDSRHVPAATTALTDLGFAPRGDLGVPGRWAFVPPAHVPPTNTYVVEAGSLSLRNHLGVRDVLRADANLRDEYAALKLRLGAELDDLDEYVTRKSAVLAKVLARAGLTAAEIDAIAGVNRAGHSRPSRPGTDRSVDGVGAPRRPDEEPDR